MIDFAKTSLNSTTTRRRIPRRRPNTVPPTPDWHAGYLQMLPTIRRLANIRMRRLTGEARTDAVQEIVADTAVAYARLA